MIRFGVVGLRHGMSHVLEVVKHPLMDLTAVCARTRETYDYLLGAPVPEGLDSVTFTDPRGRLIAESRQLKDFATVAFESDYEQLLARDDVDAVILAVPINLNASFAERALKSGKHVLSSKPFAVDVEQAASLRATVESSDRQFMLNFEFRYSPVMQLARKLIASGEIGAVRQMWWNMHRMPFRIPYRARDDSGGSFVAEVCHWLDLFNLFNGGSAFTKVCSFGGRDVVQQQDFEDNAVTIIEYDNGVRGSINFTYFTDQPEHNVFGVVGERGKISGTTENAGMLTMYSGNKNRAVFEINPAEHHGHLGFDLVHDLFVKSILGEATVDSDNQARLGYENLLAALCAQRSLDEGCVITRSDS